MKQELFEAIAAGEHALSCLKAAQRELRSAGNWGMIDLFGGGLFTNMIKHGKMQGASRSLEEACHALQIFERELGETDISSSLHLDTGDFLSFADFFFDGFAADFLMHTRISETKENVDAAIQKITYLLAVLQERYAALQA